jgi:hypothetical protein
MNLTQARIVAATGEIDLKLHLVASHGQLAHCTVNHGSGTAPMCDRAVD